jgi:hypothetical protein
MRATKGLVSKSGSILGVRRYRRLTLTRSGSGHLGDQLAQLALDAGQAFSFGQLTSSPSSDDHRVHSGRQAAALLGERLPQKSFDLVAIDGSPDLSRYRQA